MFKNKLNTTILIFILSFYSSIYLIGCIDKKQPNDSQLALKANNSLVKKDSIIVPKGLKNRYGYNFNQVITNKAFSMNISNEFVMNHTPDETSFSIYDSTKVNDSNVSNTKIERKLRGTYQITIAILKNDGKLTLDSLVKMNIVTHGNTQPKKIEIPNVVAYRYDERLVFGDLTQSKKQYYMMRNNIDDKIFLITIFSNYQTETDIDEYLQEAVKSIKLHS